MASCFDSLAREPRAAPPLAVLPLLGTGPSWNAGSRSRRSGQVFVNLQLLIDSIVRQTTVLIAQLATTGGARAPLVLRIGSGPSTAYRSATKDELEALASVHSSDGTDELVWALVFREGPISRLALAKRLRHGNVDDIVERLVAAGRVRRVERGGAEELVADHFVVPAGAEVGWEAAVFDHFQAVVKTVCARLSGQESGPQGSAIGGSTYSFDVWPGHPMEADVLNLLRELRCRVGDIRTRVRAYNAANVRPRSYSHVTFYGGQSVIVEEEDSEVCVQISRPCHRKARGRDSVDRRRSSSCKRGLHHIAQRGIDLRAIEEPGDQRRRYERHRQRVRIRHSAVA